MTPPVATSAAERETARTSAPLKLTRPLAPETIERLLSEAESAYRARRWAQALEAFNTIVELEPAHATAWFRIGNLHQRRNQLLSAASAYRKAAQRIGPAADVDADTRAKALLNLAAVNVELARLALSEIGDLPRELADAREEVNDALETVKSQVERREPIAERVPARRSPTRAAPRPTESPATAPAP